MGAPNFSLRNASKYFVIRFHPHFPEDTVEMLKESLKYKGYGTFSATKLEDNHNRSYPGQKLASLSNFRFYGDVEVGVYLEVILRDGYYEAAILDWDVELECGGFPLHRFDVEDVLADCMNRGMAKIQARNVRRWLEQTEEDMLIKTEKLFEELSEQYVKTAQFSNGETLYSKV